MAKQHKNCKNCNAVFLADEGVGLCDSCLAGDGELFTKMRDYLYEHPGTNTVELSAALGINVSLIIQFVQDGRFALMPPCKENADR